jgi:hypothetical protein
VCSLWCRWPISVEHTLLAGIGFDVLAVRAETEPEPDIPNALPATALVPQRVPRGFPNRRSN